MKKFRSYKESKKKMIIPDGKCARNSKYGKLDEGVLSITEDMLYKTPQNCDIIEEKLPRNNKEDLLFPNIVSGTCHTVEMNLVDGKPHPPGVDLSHVTKMSYSPENNVISIDDISVFLDTKPSISEIKSSWDEKDISIKTIGLIRKLIDHGFTFNDITYVLRLCKFSYIEGAKHHTTSFSDSTISNNSIEFINEFFIESNCTKLDDNPFSKHIHSEREL